MQLQLRPSETFQELVKHSGRDFTPTIYELLAYIEKPQDMEGTRSVPDAPVLSAKKSSPFVLPLVGPLHTDEHVDKAERLTKAKLKRLATLLPNLIFLIEQFEVTRTHTEGNDARKLDSRLLLLLPSAERVDSVRQEV